MCLLVHAVCGMMLQAVDVPDSELFDDECVY